MGSTSISNIFVHTQWKLMKILEAAVLAFVVSWVVGAP